MTTIDFSAIDFTSLKCHCFGGKNTVRHNHKALSSCIHFEEVRAGIKFILSKVQ